MANREGNLKKINEELEKLDDEELEKVAGGFRVLVYDQYQNTDTAQNTNNPAANQLGARPDWLK